MTAQTSPDSKETAEAERRYLCCSFCGKGQADVARLIAGPGVFICDACVRLCDQILAKEDAATLPQLDGKDDGEVLTSMRLLDASRDQVERAVAEHVRALRARGVTWARIGEELGISRQSAWERFSGEE